MNWIHVSTGTSSIRCEHPIPDLQWVCESCGHRWVTTWDAEDILPHDIPAAVTAERDRIRAGIAALRDPDAGDGLALPEDEAHLLRAEVLAIIEEEK